ncbi:hypothetical protein [Shouchella clausii]|uniref:hypothetical protein n=1 Tax=Shouchella clausii TaxID=79880 RepID=UPI000BA604D1|nr:hypothetical protein [Shouchella clausii]MDO7268740.1 hypothetical protein [Shouchella clausii]MDO7289045.1 hypothetical protein [Shouchella clausii]PAD45091.1 hypothetical protein CHI09_19425 [Shouchella clausii]
MGELSPLMEYHFDQQERLGPVSSLPILSRGDDAATMGKLYGIAGVRRSTQTPPPTLHPLSGKKIAQTGSP